MEARTDYLGFIRLGLRSSIVIAKVVMASPQLAELETALGYEFDDRSLLYQALSTRSYSITFNPAKPDNERLEFLGDSVLSVVLSQLLYDHQAQFSEGDMSQIRSSLVNSTVLGEVAIEIGLDRLIKVGNSDDHKDPDLIRARSGDAVEAIIGAIYLDGGWSATRRVIETLWGDRLRLGALTPGVGDFKSRFQEYLQTMDKRPKYVTHKEGPDHQPHFRASVLVDGVVMGVGEGNSKKEAEQGAARQGWLGWSIHHQTASLGHSR